MLVAVLDVGGDCPDQFIDAVYGQSTQPAFGEFTEEALDQVQPRRRGRGEMKLDPRVPREPALDLRSLWVAKLSRMMCIARFFATLRSMWRKNLRNS